MARAHREVPAVTWVEECDFGRVSLDLLVPTVLKACAISLREYPELNARLEGDGPPVPLCAGDIVIFPHGDPHILGNGPPVTPMDNSGELERVLSLGLKVTRMGGGGELTKFICGYMACEPQLSHVFLGGLPPLMTVNIRNSPAGQWLENSLRYSVDNADVSGPGGKAVVAKLSEVLFVETLRRYISLLPPEQTGWLAGVRDARVWAGLLGVEKTVIERV